MEQVQCRALMFTHNPRGIRRTGPTRIPCPTLSLWIETRVRPEPSRLQVGKNEAALLEQSLRCANCRQLLAAEQRVQQRERGLEAAHVGRIERAHRPPSRR
jgi:hypothetical protein